jgi:hypothetical protein
VFSRARRSSMAILQWGACTDVDKSHSECTRPLSPPLATLTVELGGVCRPLLYAYNVLSNTCVSVVRTLRREVGLKHRAEVQLQLPTAGVQRPNPTRVTLHQESVLISDVKTDDGTQYYQVSWCDKRGRSHVVRCAQQIPIQPDQISSCHTYMWGFAVFSCVSCTAAMCMTAALRFGRHCRCGSATRDF